MLELVIRGAAQRQILDIYAYYEDLQAGLGDRFEKELYAFFDRIESNPQHFQKVDSIFRRAHLQKFPFTIYYFALENQVYVVAIWPQAGSADGWRDQS